MTLTYKRVQGLKAQLSRFLEYSGQSFDFGIITRRRDFGIITIILVLGLAIAIFVSAWKTAFGIIGLGALWLTIARPSLALSALLIYLPFEQFVLKWLPDEVYLYARYAFEIAIYILVLRLLPRILIQGRTKTPIDLPFGLFCLTLVVSAVLNFVPALTALVGVRSLLRFILLFFVTIELRPSTKFIRTLATIMLVIVFVQSLLGIAEAVVGQSMTDVLLPSGPRFWGEIQVSTGTEQVWLGGQRVSGTLGRYDRLGTFLAFFLLIAIAGRYEKLSQRAHHYLVPPILLGLVTLILTFSRSAWFGFLLGLGYLALYVKRDRRVWFAGGLAAIVTAGYLLYAGIAVSHLIDSPSQTLPERFFEAFSYDRWRAEYYGMGRFFWIVETVRTVVPAAPLFGWGPGQYGGGAVFGLHNTTVYDRLHLPFGVFGTAGYIDNSWFSLWGESGTFGILLFIWMYSILWRTAHQLGTKSHDAFSRTLGLGVAAAFLAVAVNAFLGLVFEIRSLATYLWVCAAFVVVLSQREKISLP